MVRNELDRCSCACLSGTLEGVAMVCWRLWRKVGVGADAGAVEAEGADTAPALSLMVVDRLGKEL